MAQSFRSSPLSFAFDLSIQKYFPSLLSLLVLAVFFTLPVPKKPLDSLKSVFGTDDRRELELSHTPFGAIGRIELQAPGIIPWLNAKGTPICTGTLVSRDLVLTNSHCLLDRETGQLTSKTVWFRPSFGKEKADVGARAVKVWMGTLHPSRERAHDWALIKIDQPFGETYGWLDFAPLWEDLPFSSSSVSFIAYATDYRDGGVPIIHSDCRLTAFDSRGSYFRHDCDMNAGSSGGPLLRFSAGKPYILAINAAHVTPAAVSYLATFSPQFANIAIGSTRFAGLIEALRKDVAIADISSIRTFDLKTDGDNPSLEPETSASTLSSPPAH